MNIKHIILLTVVFFWGMNLSAQILDRSYIERLGGKVIVHSPQSSGLYIGSPAITIAPNGDYLSAYNFFGKSNDVSPNKAAFLCRSTDKGFTWKQIAQFKDFTNMNLFVHKGALYSIGFTQGSGQMRIIKSLDNGETWSRPTSSQNGMIYKENLYSNAPQNVVIHNGRIWYALNDVGSSPAGWGKDKVFMMSAPVDADLLVAKNWTRTNHMQAVWEYGGWLEPCAVVGPNGKMYIMPRVDYVNTPSKTALIEVNAECTEIKFDPKTDYIDFPGGASKFTVKYDSISQMYWTLSNYVPRQFEGGVAGSTRNTLALSCSKNLTHWQVRGIVIQEANVSKHGFQYVDWLFDGEDMVAAVRTGYEDGVGGANNYHNSNYLTFHRVKDFRNFTTQKTNEKDTSPVSIENFDDPAQASYTLLRQNMRIPSDLMSEMGVVENPDKSGINASDSVYMIKRSRKDYWEMGMMMYLKKPIPKDKKYMHIMINWADKATAFCTRFYGSDKDSTYVTGIIPNSDKTNCFASPVKNAQPNTWYDLVVPIQNLADIKYLFFIPDQNMEIGKTTNEYFTYYLDSITFSNDMRPRGEKWEEDCPYYGCTEPELNQIETVSNKDSRMLVLQCENGVELDFQQLPVEKWSVYDMMGRLVKGGDEKLGNAYISLIQKGVYVVCYQTDVACFSESFLY